MTKRQQELVDEAIRKERDRIIKKIQQFDCRCDRFTMEVIEEVIDYCIQAVKDQ